MESSSLQTVPPGTFAYPADMRRLETPLEIRGIAMDVTTKTLKRRYGEKYQLVALGDKNFNMNQEFDSGSQSLYRLVAGQPYRVSVVRCFVGVSEKLCPYDRRSDAQAVFFARARNMGVNRQDPLLKYAKVGLWSDGLGVFSSNGDPSFLLEANAVYKVELTLGGMADN